MSFNPTMWTTRTVTRLCNCVPQDATVPFTLEAAHYSYCCRGQGVGGLGCCLHMSPNAFQVPQRQQKGLKLTILIWLLLLNNKKNNIMPENSHSIPDPTLMGCRIWYIYWAITRNQVSPLQNTRNRCNLQVLFQIKNYITLWW